MNENLPEPLVPADCDLRDFACMPLDVRRLRDSDLSALESPEACWAAVLLWSASWHQVPAASLPDDDRILSNLAGYGRVVKEWRKVKAGALRGWVKCADGRLYHPVVAEKAVEAWNSRLDQRWKTECARIKKHNERHGTQIPQPVFEEWVAQGCPQGQRLPVAGDASELSQGQAPSVPSDKGGLSQGQGGSVPKTKESRPDAVPSETRSKGQGEGQGYIKEAEPIGSDAAGVPPLHAGEEEPRSKLKPDEIIFGYGVPLLTSAGSTDKAARSFLGGLRKTHGDAALIDKLRACIRAKPLQPLEWLAKALPPPAVLAPHESLAARNAASTEEAMRLLGAKPGEVIDA
ncbi:DUF1376 domain-containing protein [Caldimonas tepidiphila]|uniref:DUF1376 domain-containing protein n=1 Tax=Caldimonas tepidiphila TaxID=2315841 RepID=UPI001F0BA5E0|nr:DUF1376 domain-containing protein [Caldimonas tepidiphila]